MSAPVLDVRGLTIGVATEAGDVAVLDHVGFPVGDGLRDALDPKHR